MATDLNVHNRAIISAEGVGAVWESGGISRTVEIIQPINTGDGVGGDLVEYRTDLFESGGLECDFAGIRQGDTITICDSGEKYTVASVLDDKTGWLDLWLERK